MPKAKIDRFLRAAIVALTAMLVYVIYASIHQTVVEAGDTAPRFTITADNGRSVSVPNFGGKLLVLNFWASWCQPCAEETPSLSQFSQTFADKGVVVLALSVDKSEKAYRKFLQQFKPAFLTALNADLHEKYGTYMWPETYIIDSNGKVVKKIAEPVDWNNPQLVQYINSLL